MCGTCGCGESAPGGHGHAHASDARRIAVEESLLAENDRHAAQLAASLRARGIDAIGLVGGPGAGKTTLLEATLARLGERGADAVVEGDCAGDLDAHLVGHALETLDLSGVRRVWIENVGNLVCPAAFACGESRRVVLVSVAEGDDKPEKYPAILAGADLLLVTKSDLVPHVDFDVARCIARARRVAPGLPAIVLSARTGEGLEPWLDWVREKAAAASAG